MYHASRLKTMMSIIIIMTVYENGKSPSLNDDHENLAPSSANSAMVWAPNPNAVGGRRHAKIFRPTIDDWAARWRIE